MVSLCQRYSPVSASTATTHPANSRSPPTFMSALSPKSTSGVAPAVPKSKNPVTGSYVIGSQTSPPPTSHHLSPDQVFAAISSAFDSNPLAGSPGTVQNRQACLPVSASNATTDPRTPMSEPL